LVLPVFDLVMGAVVTGGVVAISGAEDLDACPSSCADSAADDSSLVPSCRESLPEEDEVASLSWFRPVVRPQCMSSGDSLVSRPEESAGEIPREGGPPVDVAGVEWCDGDRC
jgi:hypothetical protein